MSIHRVALLSTNVSRNSSTQIEITRVFQIIMDVTDQVSVLLNQDTLQEYNIPTFGDTYEGYPLLQLNYQASGRIKDNGHIGSTASMRVWEYTAIFGVRNSSSSSSSSDADAYIQTSRPISFSVQPIYYQITDALDINGNVIQNSIGQAMMYTKQVMNLDFNISYYSKVNRTNMTDLYKKYVGTCNKSTITLAGCTILARGAYIKKLTVSNADQEGEYYTISTIIQVNNQKSVYRDRVVGTSFNCKMYKTKACTGTTSVMPLMRIARKDYASHSDYKSMQQGFVKYTGQGGCINNNSEAPYIYGYWAGAQFQQYLVQDRLPLTKTGQLFIKKDNRDSVYDTLQDQNLNVVSVVLRKQEDWSGLGMPKRTLSVS